MLIISNLYILPKFFNEFCIKRFDNQHQIKIFRCSKRKTTLSHQNITCGTTNNDIFFFVSTKPFSKTFNFFIHIFSPTKRSAFLLSLFQPFHPYLLLKINTKIKHLHIYFWIIFLDHTDIAVMQPAHPDHINDL